MVGCDLGPDWILRLQPDRHDQHRHPSDETRDVAYSEWHVHPSRCGVPLKLRTVRTKTHKCTFELDSGAGELYDLVNDPEEMHNLYDDPGHRAVRRQMEDLMRARPGKIAEPLAEPIGMA